MIKFVDDAVTTICTSISSSGVVGVLKLFQDRLPTFVSFRMIMNNTKDLISHLLLAQAQVSKCTDQIEGCGY